ncbi:hypothetical protein SH661x_000860 [Planctomicrobium sp. SH661]|uniref:hypothetical protein n=1 Tax=Planctomicrobium sp. SH661 TaxID=3448124 RepID=UPI003F5B045C
MTWKGIRGTLVWMILLTLIGVIAAGGIAARWWSAKDQFITTAIHEHLEKAVPSCAIDFEAFRLVDTGHLELTHLIVRSRITGTELLRIPRIVIEIETEILRTHRRLVVREITMQSPEVILFRGADQHWNWEGVKVQPPPSAVTPSWTIKNGTVRIGCICPTDGQMRSMVLQGIQVSVQPDSFQNYSFTSTSVADTLGPVQATGSIDTQSGEWKVRGTAGEIRLNDSLLNLAGRFAPKVHEQLTQLKSTNQAILAQSQSHLPRQTATASQIDVEAGAQSGAVPMLRADLSLQFEASQSSLRSPLNYDIHGSIHHGHISDLLLPMPLYDLEGRFRMTPDLIEIESVKAANGSSTLYVNGSARRSTHDWAKNFQVRVMQLQLDQRIRGFLWGQLGKTFDMLNPSGTFDVDVELSQSPGQKLAYAINQFKVTDCRGLCDYFRYPVEHVNGEITQNGTAFELQMQGEANGRPVQARGRIDMANRDRDIDLRLEVADFPFDNAIRNALQRPEQEVIRKVLDSLNLHGTARSAVVQIIRGGETEGRVAICIDGELTDGTLNYVGFPYEVTNLTGKLRYNPLKRNTWMFEEVSGTHGTAKISGRGFYDLEEGPGALALEMTVLQAALDHDLEKASTKASPSLASAWKDFSIKGSIDVDKVSVTWTPDTDVQVALDGIHWNSGQFMAAALPYVWNNVSGTMTWSNNRLKIHSLHGDHGDHNETYLLINGAVPDSAFIEMNPGPDVAWRMFLDERILHIMKLNPDDELRRAVPVQVADALKAVDLRNPIDLSLGLEMKGWLSDRNLITASWSALTALKGNTLTAGVPISNVTGNVVHRGSWDGQNLWMEGYAELETLNALELSIYKARGPFLLKNGRLTLGTPKLSGNVPVYNQSNPYHQEQLRAHLYGGQIGLDVDVTLADTMANMTYQLEVTVNEAELGDWAKEHNINSQRLMGKVNGVLQATGKGDSAKSTTGQGWIQITPAALYELPVFAQMFTVLSFRPAKPGDAAFKYAYGDFTIRDEMFEFTKIELWGDALSLVGRGNVGYAGSKASALELDFYSTANNRIPFFGPFVKAVSDRWIRVYVFGTISQPVAEIKARVPYLNDAFAGFMQSLESGQAQRTPPRPITR